MVNKKLVTIFTLILMLLFTSVAFAGIADDVKAATQPGVIENEVDTVATSIVEFVRGIAGTLGVIFLIWAGFAFWGAGGDPNKIMMAKKLLAGFVICFIFVFMAEKMVGGFLGLIGYGGTP